MLRELAADPLWVAEMRLVFLGFDIGARMTVVRLPGGGLWVHSPIALAPELRRELDARGEVRCLVAPSRYHYLHVTEYARAYPRAKVYAAPRLQARFKDLPQAGTLGHEPPPEWAGTLDQEPIGGSSLYDEFDFFHPASRTLILTDLLFNIPMDRSWTMRLLARGLGILGRLANSRSFPLTIRDRSAVRASIERLLAWDFDRVIISHGSIVETGGKEAFRRAFSWLLK